ncbi:argonaute 2-like protein [Tanacetum coccineum]
MKIAFRLARSRVDEDGLNEAESGSHDHLHSVMKIASRLARSRVDGDGLNEAESGSHDHLPIVMKITYYLVFSDDKFRLSHELPETYVPISRPDDGGRLSMQSVKLLINHFPVKFDPSVSIFRYHINVRRPSDDESSGSRPIRKPLLRLIYIELCNMHSSSFPLHRTAYDGGSYLFTLKALEEPSSSFAVDLHGQRYTCILSDERKLNLSDMASRCGVAPFRGLQQILTATKIGLASLLQRDALHVPFDELQALNVVMKTGLFVEKISVGRGYYPTEHRREDDPHCGVAPFRGLQQSLMATKNGLALCADHSAVPFRKKMCVIDFLIEYIPEIKDPSGISRFRGKVLMALRGLRVSVTHRPTKETYIVSGLTESIANDICFELKDTRGKKEPEAIYLAEYYRRKWKRNIRHLSIPCLKLGRGKKPNYVPMEFCVLVNDTSFPKELLGTEASRKLEEVSLLSPDVRRSEISRMVHDEYAICCGGHSAKVLESFKVEVGINMTEVIGRVMAPPYLEFGHNSILGGYHDWELFSRRPVFVGMAAKRWALINCSCASGKNKLNVDVFIKKLRNRCTGMEVQMENPLVVRETCMSELSNLKEVRALLSLVIEESRKIDKEPLQLVFCVMADRGIGYGYLKWVSEAENGVLTQCCLSKNASKASSQFLANLCLKINVKLGGINVKLWDRFPHFSDDDRFMFIGADVSHPDETKRSSYSSVAALVGSVNSPSATRYIARVSLQSPGKEEIVDFGRMCLELVNAYEKLNGKKPQKIVVFRDGVSDSQFDMVLKKEMGGMKQAIYTRSYRPLITFVVARKRHAIRLFLDDQREWGNVPPGTVVDTSIVHPFQFDFYLCSHFGATGTSKPTRYSVIWDENGFSSDGMQKLIYDLSYLSARCSKSVSLVTPVYYAHLAAYRGQMLQEVARQAQSSSNSLNVADLLKNSMNFI